MTYEAYFGFSGAPFHLSPDPSFYFASRGHGDALAQVQRGVHEGQGIVVVSGEVGAGKTLLARTLLGALPPDRFAVAQLVSTQLDATELLRAIVAAFDASCTTKPQLELRANLQAVLVNEARRGRRLLLLVDEAQNLSDDGFALLETLAGGPASANGSFQVCLIGQPELRERIASGRLQGLRQLVSVSCHLGPLSLAETRAYIEHRLRTVGWASSPAFGAGAFEEVFRWTSGVPRRINLLCNRLLLSLFLESRSEVDAAAVLKTAADLRAEIGEERRARQRTQVAVAKGGGPLLCVVAGYGDHVRAAPLLRAFRQRTDLPAVVLVRAFRNDALALSRALFGDRGAGEGGECLDAPAEPAAGQAAAVTSQFETVMARRGPSAVVVIDGSTIALACGQAASREGVPVVHVGGGLRGGVRLAADEAVRVQTDHLSDLIYTSEPNADGSLLNEGIAPERIVCVGNVLIDSVRIAVQTPGPAMRGLRCPGAAQDFLLDEHDFGLVVLDRPMGLDEQRLVGEMISVLRAVSRDIPLIWPMDSRTRAGLEQSGFYPWIACERIICVAAQGYVELISLMRRAKCLLTDSWDMQEAATGLGVPCLTLGPDAARPITVADGTNTQVGQNSTLATRTVWEILYNGGKVGRSPPLWDGRAAERVARHLSQWLRQRPASTPLNVSRARLAVPAGHAGVQSVSAALFGTPQSGGPAPRHIGVTKPPQ